MAVELAIPQTSDEMSEFLMDDKRRKAIFSSEADPAKLVEFMNKYAALTNKADPGIQTQMNEQIDRRLAEFAREHLVNLKRPDNRPATVADVKASRQTGAKYNKRAQGAVLDGKFANMVQFLDTISDKPDLANAELVANRRMVQNAMSSTDPGSGGFLIPEEFRAELLRASLETSIVRPRARVIPMASLRAAIPTIDATSNASSVMGGVIAYWTEEAAALTQSQPSFGRVVLEAKKLTAYTEIPSELRQDSAISVDAVIGEAFPLAISYYEDDGFLVGTGAGMPLGALSNNNNARILQAKEATQLTTTILWENLVKMYSRMLPSSLASAVWVVSPDTFPELATMALSVGTGGSAVWLNNGVQGPPMTILGRPVLVSEKVPALEDSATLGGDVNFVDFGQYLIGDRMAMSAAVSTEYKFGNDLIAVRVIERVDGKPWMQSAIEPKNQGPTLSAYVSLGTR